METQEKILEFVPKPPPEEPSVMVIEFEGTGKAGFRVKLTNVTPAQMSSLLIWIEWYVKRVFDQSSRAEEEAEKAAPIIPHG